MISKSYHLGHIVPLTFPLDHCLNLRLQILENDQEPHQLTLYEQDPFLNYVVTISQCIYEYKQELFELALSYVSCDFPTGIQSKSQVRDKEV